MNSSRGSSTDTRKKSNQDSAVDQAYLQIKTAKTNKQLIEFIIKTRDYLNHQLEDQSNSCFFKPLLFKDTPNIKNPLKLSRSLTALA